MAMKKARQTEMTFADFFNLSNMLQGLSSVSNKAQIIENAEDYLHRGARLQSLAKKKFFELCNSIELNSVEELLYGITFPRNAGLCDIVDALKKVIRKILRNVEREDNPQLVELMGLIDPGYHAKITFVSFDQEPNAVHRRDVLEKGDQMLLLSIAESGYPVMAVYGLKNKSHTKTYTNRLYKNRKIIADIATVLAYLLLWSIVSKAVREGFLLKKEEPDETLGRRLLNLPYNYSELKNAHSLSSSYLKWPERNPWLIPKDEESLFSLWEPCFDTWNIPYQRVTEEKIELRKLLRKKWEGSWDKKPIPFTPKSLHLLLEYKLDEACFTFYC